MIAPVAFVVSEFSIPPLFSIPYQVDPSPSCFAIVSDVSIVHMWLALPLGIYFALFGVFLLGVSCGFFNVTVASTLQLRARDDVRGRVMAMYSIGILGSALIGAPFAGTLADMVGVSDTFLIIAAICAGTAVTTGWIWWSWQLSASTEADHPV